MVLSVEMARGDGAESLMDIGIRGGIRRGIGIGVFVTGSAGERVADELDPACRFCGRGQQLFALIEEETVEGETAPPVLIALGEQQGVLAVRQPLHHAVAGRAGLHAVEDGYKFAIDEEVPVIGVVGQAQPEAGPLEIGANIDPRPAVRGGEGIGEIPAAEVLDMGMVRGDEPGARERSGRRRGRRRGSR